MTVNNWPRSLALLWKRVRRVNQLKVSHGLIVLIIALIPLLLLWWPIFRSGFFRGFGETVLSLLVSVFVLWLVVFLAAAFQRFLRKSYLSQIVPNVLIRRGKAIRVAAVFLLLVFLAPTIILLSQSVRLPADEFIARYLSELLFSVIIIVLVSSIWKMFIGEELLDDMLVDLDQETISEIASKEIQQAQSLRKWMQHDDITGWYELQEDVRFGVGLRPPALFEVEQELRRLKREKSRIGHHVIRSGRRLGRAGRRPSRNGNYERQLESLLQSHPMGNMHGH